VVEEAGTDPAAAAELLAPADALGAGQEMPAAWPEAEPEPVDEGGVDEPPHAVANRATPRLSTVSLAMRGAACGSEVIENLLDLKVRTAFDAKDQVFLI
jgi:hypothetical protein